MYLDGAEWRFLSKHLTIPKRRADKRGRPRASDRLAFEGVLYVLVTGCRWQDIPPHLPGYASCFQRYKLWAQDGSLQGAFLALLKLLHRRGELQLEEAIFDGSFVPAKKTAKRSVAAKKATARSSESLSMAKVARSASR